MSAAPQLRPALNDPIVLRDQDDREYRSRVEDVGADVLTVGRPLDLLITNELGPGAELLMTWRCARGIAVLPTQLVAEHTESGLRLWSMSVTAPGWVVQRRRFVRVPASGQVSLRPADEEAGVITAHLVEISEGALRCTVDVATAEAVSPDDEVTACFRFGDREFAMPGRVGFVRLGVQRTDPTHLVIIFDEPVKDADALRKQIFAQQVRNSRVQTGGPRGR